MSTLTQTAKQIRLTVNVFLAIFILIICIRITTKIIQLITAKPPEAPKPTLALGKLPKPIFTSTEIKDDIIYDLDLIYADNLPTAPAIVPVYKKVPYTVGLMSLERAKQIAKNFGFLENQYEQISTTTYKWSDLKLPRTFTLDLVTRKYYLQYNYQKDSSVFTETSFRSTKTVETKNIEYLGTSSSLPPDISSGEQIVNLLSWNNGSFSSPEKYTDISNAAETYLQRQDLSFISVMDQKEYSYKVVGENPYQGPIRILISSSNEINKKILELDFNYYNIDKTKVGTYYTSSANEAWQKITNHEIEPVLLEIPPNENYGIVDIQEVYLAYFDQEEKQDYIQPVWVFAGEITITNGQKTRYAAYYPALSENSYTSEIETEVTE